MAKKTETSFECASCGNLSQKWLGRCPVCGEWNSYKETRAMYGQASSGTSSSKKPSAAVVAALSGTQGLVKARLLSEISIQPEDRLSAGAHEFDRVLGGGILRGSSVLLGGEPGIGKSTLLLQAAAFVAQNHEVLYVSGEESEQQIRLRADRLGLGERPLHLLASAHLDDILEAVSEVQPALVVMDSVQTLFSPEANSSAGSPNQLKFCVQLLSEATRLANAALLLVAHVTKEGIIAGPKLLEHMVDAVLYFEEAEAGLRVLRASKNRYGSTEEIGLFLMDAKGLTEVPDPSGLLLEKRNGEAPAGIVLTPVYEGSRILLVELQALTVPNRAGISRVYSDRIDQRRVARIAAVLEKHGGLSFSDQEIYVNVAGGIRINEVATDLALAAALYSARSGISVKHDLALLGEVSLAGEIRPVNHLKRRLSAARDFGITSFVGPSFSSEDRQDYQAVTRLQDALSLIFGANRTKTNQS